MIGNNLLWILALAEESGAAEAGEEMAAGGIFQMLSTMLPLVLIVVVMYFLMIRPQRKKDKKVKDMLSKLKTGDRVTTIGGVYGTIAGIKDDTVTLTVGADKVKLVFARWAIRSVEEISIENDAELLN
jgi:preprotein translocase subunit YajC